MFFLQDFIEFDYLKRSLLAILLASIASGIVGGYVVARRQSYLIGAVSQCMDICTISNIYRCGKSKPRIHLCLTSTDNPADST